MVPPSMLQTEGITMQGMVFGDVAFAIFMFLLYYNLLQQVLG